MSALMTCRVSTRTAAIGLDCLYVRDNRKPLSNRIMIIEIN